MILKTKNPIDNLLRPALECWSALTSFVVGLLFFIQPHAFLLSVYAGRYLGLALVLFSLFRLREGYRVIRYRRHIRCLPAYVLPSHYIPKKNKKLFLGKGFRWQIKHTQRLYYATLPQAESYLKEHWCDRLRRPQAVLGGNLYLHGVEPHESNVWLNLEDRVGHTLILGTTRVGKTRLLELMVAQDIKRHETVIVFDPKGDADLLRRMVYEAEVCGRQEDVLIFHLGFPQVSARYNPIGHFARITEVANRLANQLPGSGESAAFKEFGWRFVNIIAKALVALGRKPDYQHIQRYILNIDTLLLDYCQWYLPQVDINWEAKVAEIEQNLVEHQLPQHLRSRSKQVIAIVNYIQQLPAYDSVASGLCSAFSYDKTYFDKITASLLPLIEKLTTGRTAELISPDYFDVQDKRPIFDWLQVIRGKKIVYVGLDALSDATVATAVGNSMFADLCSVAGQLYKYGVDGPFNGDTHKTFYPINIHCDEFNELIGEEFVPLANKSGGSGFRLHAYTQTWSDIEARLGNQAKAGQIAGNFNTLICLRVLEEETARLLTSKLALGVRVPLLQPVSSVNDAGDKDRDFTTHNEDRVVNMDLPLLTPGDVMQLPKGQAFCLLAGGQLWKIRIPLAKDKMHLIPASVEKMALAMQRHDLLAS